LLVILIIVKKNNLLEYQEAPALPLPDGVQPKAQMQEMEDFLDELLT